MSTTSPTCFDLSDWSVISISGPDRAGFLHSFCTNDVKSLKPGHGCEAFITNIKGRILGHVLVFAGEGTLTLIAVPGSNQVIVPHLQKYLLGVEAEVVDVTGQKGVLCLNRAAAEGLQSGGAAPPTTFTGCVTPDENWQNAARELGLSGGDACEPGTVPERPGEHVSVRGFADSFLACTELLPEFGWLMIGPTESAKSIASSLETRGVRASSAEEFDALRIEAGFPWHGRDISEENIAQEAGRTEKTISFRKGCYLGQEPIARLDAMGHTNKELRRLVIDSDTPPAPGAVIKLNGAEVGRVTSSGVSSRSGKSVALAMLKTATAGSGVAIQIQVSDGHTVDAVVS